MAQQSRVGRRDTTVRTDKDGALCCVYHKTTVAKRHADGTVTLDSGGWRTVTTKTRMNQFAAQHCGGMFQVCQSEGVWYVVFLSTGFVTEATHRPAMLFADGITFAVPA